jgi:hypothetical protein
MIGTQGSRLTFRKPQGVTASVERDEINAAWEAHVFAEERIVLFAFRLCKSQQDDADAVFLSLAHNWMK